MKNNLKRINKILENSFLNNINLINSNLYVNPYRFEKEINEDDEPILFI